MLGGTRDFLFFKTVQTGSGAHPPSYSKGAGLPSWEKSGQGMKLTIHLHLMLRLRMNDVINKMYTQRRITQLYIYLPLATGFGLPDHLQAFVLYTKSIYNW